MKKLILVYLAAVFLATGCIGGPSFKEMYLGAAKERIVGSQGVETCDRPTLQKFSQSVPLEEAYTYLAKNGYQVLGYSEFNGTEEFQNNEKARLTGARKDGCARSAFSSEPKRNTASSPLPCQP